MLDYRMNTFLVLCDEMNYRKTAEILNMTQPSVTQHIQYLEKYYDCRFFKYDGKQLIKTDKAATLEQYARSEKYNASRLKEQLHLVEKQNLRIGATKTIGDYMLCDQIPNLVKKDMYEVTVIVNNTKTLLNMLDHQQLDLVVAEGIFNKERYGYQLYREEAFVGVCHKDHPYASREVPLSSIVKEHLIIRESGSGTRQIFEQILQSGSYDLAHFKRRTCLSSLKMIESMIVNGDCITFAYESFAKSNAKMASFRLKYLHHVRELNFVYLKNTDVLDWINLLGQ